MASSSSSSSSSSVTASPSTQEWTYDVFLSFRGADTRKTFIDFLYKSLERKGIRTFKDEDQLKKGYCISPSLLKAIQESQFLIAVFSKGYASSKWCLEELATMMECHEKFKEQIVVPIFFHVEPSDVRKQEGSFGDSFKELVETFVKDDEEEEKVRRWKEALKNAGYLKGHHLQNDYKGYEATCAENVAADIDARLYHASLAFEENLLVGLESRVNHIGNWLRLASDYNDDDVRFIGICGMGGIGKTTMAMVIFNKFSLRFDGACFLADVRQHNIIESQKTLLTKILKEESGVEINNVQDGIGKIKRRLKEKKVLIVLDDVDDKLEQLDKLAGGGDWFGRGSRVIITTRDAGVLRSHRVDKKYVYDVHTLEDQVAIQLFSCYAFKSEIPAIGFEILSGLIVHYCKGLPLALKILGSSLCGLEAADWESTLEQLKDTPNDHIDAKLKISFDRLDSKNKKIFLHIACFFRHQKEKHVKEALKSCNLLPMGLRVLIEKSLISVEEGRIEMHDLIQEMGWHIARDEKHRSRVWEFKEVDDVLCGKMDPKHIEFIVFPYTCGFRWQNISSAFKALKILIGKQSRSYNEEEDNNFDRDVMDDYPLPSSLRWLHFPYYPFRSLPTSFHPLNMDTNPSELVGLCLHHSSLKNCWITKELTKFTYLDLSYSNSLLETPNFDMMPNLRSLDLSCCNKLREIHLSVGRLEKLVLLDVSFCYELKKLPNFIQVSSLQFLKLKGCHSLKNFPEIQKSIPLVVELNLESTWNIRELPSSILQLRGLTKLRLCRCEDLVSLSDDLCELENLKILELRYCPKLESLPEKLGNLSKLKELHVFDTAIFQFPSSITQLSSLECLRLGGNGRVINEERSFILVPIIPGLLTTNDIGCFTSLESEIEYLNHESKNFVSFLACYSELPSLRYLDISGSEELHVLELPATIRELYANFSFASERRIAKLATEYPKLYFVSFSFGYNKDVTFSAVELARKFAHEPFLFMRNSSFIVTYPDYGYSTDITKWFKYSSHHSNKISISLKSSWHNRNFVGFVVCFILNSRKHIWKSCPDGRPFRYDEVIAQLLHKDNEKVLQTNCVIGRHCDEEFGKFKDSKFICFVYIPFASLFNNNLIATPSDYLVFEVTFGDPASNASTDWSCDLLYKNDESLCDEAMWSKIWSKTSPHDNSDSGQCNEESPLFEEAHVPTQPEPVEDNGHEFNKVIFDDDVSIDEEFPDEELHIIERWPKYSGEPEFLPYGLMPSTSSATASQSIHEWACDTFLSFRVQDTFIDYLYGSLERKGIHTFKDNDGLEKGGCISKSQLKAIQESKFFIAVFSKGYASSQWCLEELATIMERQEKLKVQIVVPIFYQVEPSDFRNQKGSFEDSFKELVEKIGKDDEEKVRRWKEALRKAGDLKGHHLQNDYKGHEAKCAEGVASDILARLNQQASLAFEENLVGLESRVNDIGKWLRLVSDDDDVRFIGICGMKGIGKTTIAMAVFNRFLLQFDGACFLADVRQHNVIELQKTLLTTILKEKSEVKISRVQDGMVKIEKWLGGEKVLIVLDDVDQVEQLQKLAGRRDWFGRGSRVIITTGDAGVLRFHGVDEKYIYPVHTLGEEESIQLFRLYAFKEKPKTRVSRVEQLCESVVRYCEGLPLALKVLGSSLCGREATDWESTLKDLKDTPNNDIHGKLKISFDRLDSKNKKIFLHIACFFRHQREEYVKDVLKSCGLHPDSAMRNLNEKSLISVIDDGRVEMHDLIQEMGWHIAREEERRSRVWQLKDVDDVLSGEMDPKHIEGICWFDEVSGWADRPFEISMREMRNLKMLKVGDRGHVFHLKENYLPSSLRWLQFDFYNFTSLPESFASSKLVCLSLRYSSLQHCTITQKLDKLTLLDLSCSSSLLETSDFDSMPNLMRLYLGGCMNLKVVHPSIGNLSKLVLLDLSECSNLESLPSFNKVSSLNSLDLCNCIELKKFPKMKTRTPHLVELDLINVGIIELPSSIKQLHDLTKLRLYDCKHLECLCDGLYELKNLKVLKIQNCRNLKSLPENVESLNSLEYLSLKGSNFDSLPESFSQLPCLQHLDIRSCSELKVLPKLPKTIRQLYADPSFAFRGNIADVAKKCSELHSLAFSFVDERWPWFSLSNKQVDERWPWFSLSKMFIRFPFQRKSPTSVNFPVFSEVDPITGANAMRFFQYECYDSNGISISFRYCKSFVGFAVYFFSSENDIWEPQFGQDIDDTHCTVIAKLSHKDDGNEVFQRKCVIAKPDDEGDNGIKGDMCFLFIPFSSLWPAESTTNIINNVSRNDFSRFEVNFMNLEATGDWGCSLLYKRRKRPCSWDDSHQGCTTDIGPLDMLKYLNLSGKKFEYFLAEDISRLRRLQYLDISGCGRVRELPELPPTIRELYANSYLASENNIVELATKYSELYSVSFSEPIYIDGYPAPPLVPRELAKKFIPITQPFLNRNTSFVVTYPLDSYIDYKISRCFKYPHHDPHYDPYKISISLDPTWYNHKFVGFVVCFVFPIEVRWESHAGSCPFRHSFRHCELITKLTHKDNGSEPPLKTKCVIGRPYYEEFSDSVHQLVCFAYIPFSSLWPKSKPIRDNISPNHYLVFEAAIQDLEISIRNNKLFWRPQSITHNATPNWSCGLLYTDDDSLTEAIRQKREIGSSESDSDEDEEEDEEEEEDKDEYEDDDEEDGDGDGDGDGDRDRDEEEEEEEDVGSKYTIDSDGDDAMTEDNNSGIGSKTEEDEDEDEEEEEDKDEYEDDDEEDGDGDRYEEEEEEEDGGSKYTKDSDGDDAMTKENNSEHIDDEEASMVENSVIHVALSEDQPAFTQPNPIIGEEIQSDHSYHNDNEEEDYETTTSQQELGPDRTELWELIEIVDRVQCQMVSMPDCSEVKNLLPNSGLPMINDVSGVNLEEVVSCITLSNDDSYVVSTVRGKASLFNIMTNEVTKTITLLPYASTFLAFDPHDNNTIAIGTEKSSICIYDWVNEYACLLQCIIPHVSLFARISSTTYSCNDQLIYASFIDGNIGVLDADTLKLKCSIVLFAYLPHQLVLNESQDVYPLVIAAHPQEPNKFAVGLTDGSIEEIQSDHNHHIEQDCETTASHQELDSACIEEDYADELFIIKSLRSATAAITKKLLDNKRHLKNELSKERSRNKELVIQLQDEQPTIDELEKEKHELTLLVQTYQARATQAEAANSDLLQRYGTLEKLQLEEYKKLERYGTLEQLEEYEAKETNAGHSVKVAMSEHNDSVKEEEEEEEEEENKQRKNARLYNKDKEDIIINSGKQNKGKNEQNDGRGELLATNVFVDDAVFQRLGNDCKQLYNLLRLTPNIPDYIDVELDANIFHHTNMECIFVMVEDIKDLFTMNWLDVSIIQVFIRYLYGLCKEYKVNSIGFMCPTQIAKANVDMNLEAVMEYLPNTISKLQDKTFILAPYHQVNHWLLLVICISSRMVYVLDPMQCDCDLEIKPVLNMVLRTFTNQRGTRARCRVGWKNIKCPRQPGNSECGYYVMRYMYDICRKYFANTLLDEVFQETEGYSDKEIDEIRNMWAKHFLKECV